MILPIITAVSREVFLQTPRLHEEAALALGATRWELIRMAVLPFGRSGVDVRRDARPRPRARRDDGRPDDPVARTALLVQAARSRASSRRSPANIAARFNDANDIGRSTLIATGLALFVITLLVNLAARAIIARRKDFSGAN